MFFKHQQMEAQTFDKFYIELKKLVMNCDLNDLENNFQLLYSLV